jgi:hypothetical protein
VKLYVLYRGTLRRTGERVVSAQAVRADSAFAIRAQARHLLLPIAHVRNQKISLNLITLLRKCSTYTQDIILTRVDVS